MTEQMNAAWSNDRNDRDDKQRAEKRYGQALDFLDVVADFYSTDCPPQERRRPGAVR